MPATIKVVKCADFYRVDVEKARDLIVEDPNYEHLRDCLNGNGVYNRLPCKVEPRATTDFYDLKCDHFKKII